MFSRANYVPKPSGFFTSTEQWVKNARLRMQSASCVKYNGNEPLRAYGEPKGLEKPVHWKFIREYKSKPPPTFLAILPHARVWGPKGAIISCDNKLLWDVSLDYGTTAGTHPVFSERRLPPFQNRQDTVAVLTFCASHYYYHWMFDVLPRLELLRRSKVAYNKIVINYDGTGGLPRPFQEETLSRIGICKESIIHCHPHFHLKARELAVPSLAGYTGHMPAWTCDFLRNNFLSQEKLTAPGYERLYISREKASTRKVLNEDKIFGLLANLGFKKVLPEFMPVTRQAELFSSAEIIISPHGGGLTNLVFCRPRTKVLEFFSPHYVNVVFWILSNHLDLDYYYLIGEGKRPPDYVDPHSLWDDICINLDQLSCILNIMGIY